MGKVGGWRKEVVVGCDVVKGVGCLVGGRFPSVVKETSRKQIQAN